MEPVGLGFEGRTEGPGFIILLGFFQNRWWEGPQAPALAFSLTILVPEQPVSRCSQT